MPTLSYFDGNGNLPPKQHALACTSEGWRVHPLHDTHSGVCSCGKPDCQWPGKHPRLSGYKRKATNDSHEVERLFAPFPQANIGGIVPPGFAVVDVDRRHGGEAALAALEEAHGNLPVTVTVETAGGGWHYSFRLPDGCTPSSQKVSVSGYGVELLLAGSNLVLPGSVVNGIAYRYAKGRSPHDVAIAELPKWLLEESPPPELPPNRTQSTNTRMKRVLPASIPNGTRHIVLPSIAGTLINNGVRGESLAAELIKIDATHCMPPLGEAEARKIAKSMQQTHDNKQQDDAWKSKNRAQILEVTRYAIAASDEWKGIKGKSELAALLGALAIAYEKHTIITPAAYRPIAEHGQISLKATQPAVKRLIKKGWMVLHASYKECRRHLQQQNASPEELAEASNVYRFAIPKQCREKTTDIPTPPQAHSLLSLSGTEVTRNRGLGKSGIQLLVILLRGIMKSRRQLALQAGVSADVAERKVKKMLAVGMVKESERGIELCDLESLDLEKIAKRLGTFGKGIADKERHAAQRERYHVRIGLIVEKEYKGDAGEQDAEPRVYRLANEDRDSAPPSTPQAEVVPVPIQVSENDSFISMTLAVFHGAREVSPHPRL